MERSDERAGVGSHHDLEGCSRRSPGWALLTLLLSVPGLGRGHSFRGGRLGTRLGRQGRLQLRHRGDRGLGKGCCVGDGREQRPDASRSAAVGGEDPSGHAGGQDCGCGHPSSRGSPSPRFRVAHAQRRGRVLLVFGARDERSRGGPFGFRGAAGSANCGLVLRHGFGQELGDNARGDLESMGERELFECLLQLRSGRKAAVSVSGQRPDDDPLKILWILRNVFARRDDLGPGGEVEDFEHAVRVETAAPGRHLVQDDA